MNPHIKRQILSWPSTLTVALLTTACLSRNWLAAVLVTMGWFAGFCAGQSSMIEKAGEILQTLEKEKESK